MEQSSGAIDPNDLLIFAHVADLGSFSRAAERLGLPKSSVSRRLAALEQRLGERLLLRTTRRQTLTEFGQLLLEHARQVVAEVDAVAALSVQRQITPSGRLRVSMPGDFAHLLLAGALARFVVDYPGIHLALDLSPRRVDLLGEGFDLAIRVGDLPDDSLLAARLLCTVSNGLYAAPAYLARAGMPETPADLQQHDALGLLGRGGEIIPWHLKREEARVVITPRARLAGNSPELLIRLACAGAGIAAVPDAYALPDLQHGRLVRILPDWQLPGEPVSAVFPGRRLVPPKTRALIDTLIAALSTPSPGSPGPTVAPARA